MTGSRLAALLDQATPGPWEVVDGDKWGWPTKAVALAGEGRGAPVAFMEDDPPDVVGRDARLIALAPDMARLLLHVEPVLLWAEKHAADEHVRDEATALLAWFAALDEKAGAA